MISELEGHRQWTKNKNGDFRDEFVCRKSTLRFGGEERTSTARPSESKIRGGVSQASPLSMLFSLVGLRTQTQNAAFFWTQRT